MTSAFATGLATIHSNDTVLDVWFPDPKLSDDVRESGTEFPDKVPAELHPLAHIDAARETRRYTIYFYNPNIHPLKEYMLRKEKNMRFADKLA